MQPMDRIFSRRSDGKLDGILSLTSGAVSVGLIIAYIGPFLNVVAGVASFVYTTTFMFRLITPKRDRGDLKDWG